MGGVPIVTLWLVTARAEPTTPWGGDLPCRRGSLDRARATADQYGSAAENLTAALTRIFFRGNGGPFRTMTTRRPGPPTGPPHPHEAGDRRSDRGECPRRLATGPDRGLGPSEARKSAENVPFGAERRPN